MPSIYYVATNGSDSNPGTLERPFATLQHAASRVATGDTVNVRGGTYQLSDSVWIGNSGTATQPIVFQSSPGEKVVLDGSRVPANTLNLIGIGGQHITIKGFEVINSPSVGISVWGGKHVKLLNNVVRDTQGTGIFVGYSDLSQVKDILVQGNTVYHTNLKHANVNSWVGGWGQGITVSGEGGKDNIRVLNNTVYENHGEGIGFWRGTGALISGNTLRDNYATNIYLDNAENATVDGNFIYTTNNKKYFSPNGPASGIQVAHENGRTTRDNTISNNIVVGASYGFYYGDYMQGGGLKNTKVINNTFYKATQALIRIDDSPGHEQNQIADNIFYQTDGKPMTMLTASPILGFRDNLWFGGAAGPASGPGDLNTDPRFVNPGGTSAGDYRLQAGSPAIVAGVGSTLIGGGGTVPNPPVDVVPGGNKPVEVPTGGSIPTPGTDNTSGNGGTTIPIEGSGSEVPIGTGGGTEQPTPGTGNSGGTPISTGGSTNNPAIPPGNSAVPILVAKPDLIQTQSSNSTRINILENDTIAGEFTLSLADPPAKGSIRINNNDTPNNAADDFVLYTPQANATGDDSFSYQLSAADGTTTTATVRVRISEAPAPTFERGTALANGVVDLRRVDLDNNGIADERVQLKFSNINSEAEYSNTVGFYRIADETGAVLNPGTDQLIRPGEAGYAQAALSQRINSTELNRHSGEYSTSIETGAMLASYIITNGTADQFLRQNSSNRGTGGRLNAYFSFGTANGDRFNHIKVANGNQYRFEDLWGGGDKDFNDFAFKMEVQTA